jgi:hypothetical protein
MFTPVAATQQFPEMEKALLDKWYSTGIIDGYLHKNDKNIFIPRRADHRQQPHGRASRLGQDV